MKESQAREIWKALTPAQRAQLAFVADVDAAEVTGLVEDDHRASVRMALRRAGFDNASWSKPPRGSVLVRRNLIKGSTGRGDHYELTPIGRRVIKHVEAILRKKAPPVVSQKEITAQLDAEITEALGHKPG